MRGRFATETDRALAKASGARRASGSASTPLARLITPRVQSIARRLGVDLATVTGSGAGGAIRERDLTAPSALTSPRATGYPAHWTAAAGHASTAPQRSSGAGRDYPAHWDTSPVDANDSPGARPARSGTPAGERRPSGAGVDYPAHWKR